MEFPDGMTIIDSCWTGKIWMATTFEDCKRMVTLAEEKGLIFMSLPFDLNPVFLAPISLTSDTLENHRRGSTTLPTRPMAR